MFKLGVITDEISQDFDLALDRMVEWDLPFAEIRGLWGKNVSDLGPEELRRAKAALRDRGLQVCGVASPFYKCELSGGHATEVGRLHLAQDRALDEQRDVLRRCIDGAHLFETPYIRVFAFWRRGPTTPEIAERITELFHEPLRTAREAGVTLLIENESDTYMGTGVETAAFVRGLADEGLRAVWDPANAFDGGEASPYPDGYEALKPYIVHVHVKDMTRGPDGTYRLALLGQGDIDYVGQFRALNRDGYSGVISIETHYLPEGGTPEGATAETVRALRSLLEQAS